jgi:predicted MPP superfamily phosphohydrolase
MQNDSRGNAPDQAEKNRKTPERKPLSRSRKEKPVKEDGPKEDKPIKEDAPKEDKPIKEDAPKEDKPIKEDAPKEDKPVKEDVPKEDKPVKEDAPKEDKPVKEDAPKEDKPVKEDAPKKNKPKKEDVLKEDKPVKEDAPKEDKPVKEDAPKEDKPVKEDASKEDKPVKEDAPKEDKPVKEDASKEDKPVKEDAPKEDKTEKEAPVKGKKERPKKKKKEPKVKRNWLLRLLFVAVVAGAMYYAYLQLTDISHFEVSFYTVEQEEIQSPVRIAFLSDLHLNEFGEDNIDLVNEVARLKPDLIAIGGDMTMMHNPDYSIVLSLCSQLKEIAPVYYGIGNHEYNDILFEGSNILYDLKKAGVTVLSNHYVTINVNGNTIDIGGLNETMDQFEQYGTKFWNKYDEKATNYRLLLVHDPGYFRTGGKLVGKNIDLALCGHYHGGQIILPIIGPLYHPEGGFRPQLASGCNLVEDTYVITSRGMGNHSKLPRFNNPPELVVIDLY